MATFRASGLDVPGSTLTLAPEMAWLAKMGLWFNNSFDTIGALISRIGFWGLLYDDDNYKKEPPNPIVIIKAPILSWSSTKKEQSPSSDRKASCLRIP